MLSILQKSSYLIKRVTGSHLWKKIFGSCSTSGVWTVQYKIFGRIMKTPYIFLLDFNNLPFQQDLKARLEESNSE